MKHFANRIIIAILLLMSCSLQAIPPKYSLLDNKYFSDTNSLYFNFYNTNFVWNNEYFNDITQGYTLIGYFIQPTLQYHFSENVKAEAGIHLLKYTGAENFSTYTPVYSVTYHKNDFFLVLGTLYGNLHHRLPEPIFHSERFFTSNLEQGTQIIYDNDRLFIDFWVDWQTFIFPNDAKQEELLAGLSVEPVLLKTEQWEIGLPASLITGHRGGQIDTSQANMKTAMNMHLGVKATRKFNGDFLTGVTAQTNTLQFIDNSPTVESIYTKGSGFLTTIKLCNNNSYLKFGYWNSKQFLSLMGHPIYQSFSEKGAGYHQKKRQLLTTSLLYTKTVYPGIYIGAKGETYLDINSGSFDYSFGLTLAIKNNFFIGKYKKTAQKKRL